MKLIVTNEECQITEPKSLQEQLTQFHHHNLSQPGGYKPYLIMKNLLERYEI